MQIRSVSFFQYFLSFFLSVSLDCSRCRAYGAVNYVSPFLLLSSAPYSLALKLVKRRRRKRDQFFSLLLVLPLVVTRCSASELPPNGKQFEVYSSQQPSETQRTTRTHRSSKSERKEERIGIITFFHGAAFARCLFVYLKQIKLPIHQEYTSQGRTYIHKRMKIRKDERQTYVQRITCILG